jgi:hypothetical protein
MQDGMDVDDSLVEVVPYWTLSTQSHFIASTSLARDDGDDRDENIDDKHRVFERFREAVIVIVMLGGVGPVW